MCLEVKRKRGPSLPGPQALPCLIISSPPVKDRRGRREKNIRVVVTKRAGGFKRSWSRIRVTTHDVLRIVFCVLRLA